MITDITGLLTTIKEEMQENMDIAVVGLSGGVDSLVCATLATLALGAENVYCVHMPHNDTDYTPGKFNSNSMKIAEKLGVESCLCPIGPVTNELNRVIKLGVGQHGSKLNIVNEGNSRSRMRMAIVYGITHELAFTHNKRARVLGTGNLSEDFIGYDTKGGDALADLFLIGELLKSEVYQLAEHFVELRLITKEMIDYNPSAGLWDGQSDEAELGYSYASMEPSILKVRNPETGFAYKSFETPVGGTYIQSLTDVDLFVLNRHFANRHKHMAPPSIPLREFCE